MRWGEPRGFSSSGLSLARANREEGSRAYYGGSKRERSALAESLLLACWARGLALCGALGV